MSRPLLWSAAACALLFSTTPAALAQAVLATTRAADRVTVTGRVADARTGEGVPGATVRADGMPLGTETDADGRFSVTVPGRVTTIAVWAVGGVSPKSRSASDTVPSFRTSTVPTFLAPGYSGASDITRGDVMLRAADPA